MFFRLQNWRKEGKRMVKPHLGPLILSNKFRILVPREGWFSEIKTNRSQIRGK